MRDVVDTALYREITKAARRLDVLMRDLGAPTRDDLQLATMESGGARGDALRALVALGERLNDFAAGSVALEEVFAYGIGRDE